MSSEKKTGFALLPTEEVRALGRKGAQAAGSRRHQWTSEEARAAGHKGALARIANQRAREAS